MSARRRPLGREARKTLRSSNRRSALRLRRLRYCGTYRKRLRVLKDRLPVESCVWRAPLILVLDNLLEGVLVPDVYDATLNPLYRDVLAHYGAVALPCRIQDPDRKGKVERHRSAAHSGAIFPDRRSDKSATEMTI